MEEKIVSPSNTYGPFFLLRSPHGIHPMVSWQFFSCSVIYQTVHRVWSPLKTRMKLGHLETWALLWDRLDFQSIPCYLPCGGSSESYLIALNLSFLCCWIEIHALQSYLRIHALQWKISGKTSVVKQVEFIIHCGGEERTSYSKCRMFHKEGIRKKLLENLGFGQVI